MSDVPTTETMPECCYAPKGAPLAHRLYAAYCRGQQPEHAGRYNDTSPIFARWEDLSEVDHQRWEAAAYERVCENLLEEAERLEADIAVTAQKAGRGRRALALNVAKTQVGGAIGWLLRARRVGGAVGSG